MKIKIDFFIKVVNDFLFLNRYNRLQRIKAIRWDFGSIIPPEIRANMSGAEVSIILKLQYFFQK